MITEKTYKEQIEALQKQIIEMERLSLIGQMTAGIMHEIKNPLNFVTNFSRLSNDLLLEMSDILKNIEQTGIRAELEEVSQMLKGNIDKINEHGQRAQRIIQGILNQSRNQKAEFGLANYNQIIEDYTKLAYHGVRGENSAFNATITYNFDKNIAMVPIVEKNFSRVVLNLVNNACYAVDKRKKTEGDNFEPEITVSTYLKTNKVYLSVKDNGCGIPESIKTKIFESFFSTKPVGEGTGLGLAISYDIVVNEHKGEIKVDSIENKFTEFLVIIPQKQA